MTGNDGETNPSQ